MKRIEQGKIAQKKGGREKMKGYEKLLLCLLLVVGVVGMGLPVSFCRGEEMPKKQISGEIVSVDVEKSTVIIKQLKDAKDKVYEEMTVLVDSSTNIEKDYNEAGLSLLAAGDEVTVDFATNKEGANIASYISAQSQE